jgi:hypothetical protein
MFVGLADDRNRHHRIMSPMFISFISFRGAGFTRQQPNPVANTILLAQPIGSFDSWTDIPF